jgi:hypothetical protein
LANDHRKSTLDRARDELMSHVVRCDVLDARMADRHAWLDDTLKYLKDRYPDLGALELTQLEMLGRQFIEPAIPYGKGNTALNRPEATVLTEDGERITESEAGSETSAGPEIGAEAPAGELQPA